MVTLTETAPPFRVVLEGLTVHEPSGTWPEQLMFTVGLNVAGFGLRRTFVVPVDPALTTMVVGLADMVKSSTLIGMEPEEPVKLASPA